MARITVEDCFDKIKNRFELVLVAVQRARDIHSGAPITIEKNKDKDIVVALREIAADTIVAEKIKRRIVERSKISNSLNIEKVMKNSQNNDISNSFEHSFTNKKENLEENFENYTDIDLENVFKNPTNSNSQQPNEK
ncbi:MAG: DNA-directed RNA polymerase subunit omega [Rickettsia sp.]|nr:DNA-directed RNA polymerase subunit omega [Rickettsia sp.]